MSRTEEIPKPEHRTSAFPARWLLVLVLVGGLSAFYALGLYRYLSWDYLRANLDQLQARVQERLVLSAILFVVGYTLVISLSLPVAGILTVLSGALFGRWLGTLLSSTGSVVGATLAFLSSRYLFRDLVQRHFGHRLTAFNEGVRREGGYYLFTLRLVPVFPFFLLNLGMGLTSMSLGTYVWVSLLGIFSPSVVVSFVLLGTLPLLFRKLLTWKVR
jgi:uncharacterized membrane protein YdjX (TVP38/TMEM64 family)